MSLTSQLEALEAKRAAGKEVYVIHPSTNAHALFGGVGWGGSSPQVYLQKEGHDMQIKTAAEWRREGFEFSRGNFSVGKPKPKGPEDPEPQRADRGSEPAIGRIPRSRVQDRQGGRRRIGRSHGERSRRKDRDRAAAARAAARRVLLGDRRHPPQHHPHPGNMANRERRDLVGAVQVPNGQHLGAQRSNV